MANMSLGSLWGPKRVTKVIKKVGKRGSRISLGGPSGQMGAKGAQGHQKGSPGPNTMEIQCAHAFFFSPNSFQL